MISPESPSGVLLEASLGLSLCVSIYIRCISGVMMCVRSYRVDTTCLAEGFHDTSLKPLGRSRRNFLGDLTVYFDILNVYYGRHVVYPNFSSRYHGFGGGIS